MEQISGKLNCQKHKGLEFVALNQSKQDLGNKELCLQCLAENSKKKVILIKQSVEKISDIKSTLKLERINKQERNIQVIKDLMDGVQNLKNSYIQQFEKILCTLEKWILLIQSQEEDLIQKLDSAELIDVNEFVQFASESTNSQLGYNQEFKSELQSKFLALTENNLLKNCIQSLSNVESITNEFQYNDDQSDLYLECEQHKNQNIILFDLSEKRAQQKRIACAQCVDEVPSISYKSIKFVREKWHQVQSEKQENMERNSKILEQKVELILNCFEQIKQKYQLIIEEFSKKIKQNFNEYLDKVSTNNFQLHSNWSEYSKEQICEIAEKLSKPNKANLTQDPLIDTFKQLNKFINKSIKDTLLHLQECEIIQLKRINFTKNPLAINQLEKLNIEYLQEQEIENDIIKKSEETENLQISYNVIYNYQQQQSPYELQRNKSIKQQNWCHAVAFNKDCSILLASCNEQINVYKFEDQIRQQLQVLNGHVGCVTVLKFMNITNSFLSASADSTIMIWQYHINNFWFCQQKLSGHDLQINCLELSKDENTIFSCGDDKKIIIWKNNEQLEISQQIFDHTSSVYGLNLNASQNKLVSCGLDLFILVFEFQEQNNQWNLIQKIQTKSGGYRLCFVSDYLFTFQPKNLNVMEVYSLDQHKQYTRCQGIAIKKAYDQNCFFAQQYIEQKKIIINKSGSNINIIKVHETGLLGLEQQIEFGTDIIFGAANDNGEYLITWDQITKELQIRKFLE